MAKAVGKVGDECRRQSNAHDPAAGGLRKELSEIESSGLRGTSPRSTRRLIAIERDSDWRSAHLAFHDGVTLTWSLDRTLLAYKPASPSGRERPGHQRIEGQLKGLIVTAATSGDRAVVKAGKYLSSTDRNDRWEFIQAIRLARRWGLLRVEREGFCAWAADVGRALVGLRVQFDESTYSVSLTHAGRMWLKVDGNPPGPVAEPHLEGAASANNQFIIIDHGIVVTTSGTRNKVNVDVHGEVLEYFETILRVTDSLGSRLSDEDRAARRKLQDAIQGGDPKVPGVKDAVLRLLKLVEPVLQNALGGVGTAALLACLRRYGI